MANVIREFINLFSTRAIIKSNILSTNFSPIGGGTVDTSTTGMNPHKSNFSAFAVSRYVQDFIQKIDELKTYEQTELVETALAICSNYVSNYFTDSDSVISIISDKPEDREVEKKINSIFKQLSYIDTVKNHLSEIIYYGSYSIKIDWDKQDRVWRKYELQNPYSVISVYEQGVSKFNLVLSRDRKLVQVAPNAIIKVSQTPLHLINDLRERLFDTSEDRDEIKNDTLINKYDMISGLPLFYNVLGKLKEYLLKDQMISILSIKDLIQPLLLLIRVDNKTDPTEANNLALNTEQLINKYSDLSAIFGANFGITDLMDSILNNIRVLPDYQSVIGDMNSVDLSKVSNKIQDISSSLDNSKESLYMALGIPRALFSGDTTKWEALKGSERLNSRITNIINGINLSTIDAAGMLYYLLTKKSIDKRSIRSNLFTKTDVDYNNAITSSDIVNQLVDSINRILESIQRFTQENKLVDIEEYVNYFRDQMKKIDPDILKFLPDEKIREFVKGQLKAQKESESGGFGGGYGRFSKPKELTITRTFSE